MDSQLGLAGRVQLEVSSQRGVSQALCVHEESAGGEREVRKTRECLTVPSPHLDQIVTIEMP